MPRDELSLTSLAVPTVSRRQIDQQWLSPVLYYKRRDLLFVVFVERGVLTSPSVLGDVTTSELRRSRFVAVVGVRFSALARAS